MPSRSSRESEPGRSPTADPPSRKRNRSRRPEALTKLAVCGVTIFLSAQPAQAAERSVSDVVLVDQGTVIDGDLYAAGNRVVIGGRVDGDLVVAAYEDVTVTGTGTVAGDVIGVAGSVIVAGTVEESVRVASPRVDVTGAVGGDVILLAWDAILASDVGGEATLWTWTTEIAGSIEGDLEGQMRRLLLGGRVGGNVDVTVDRLEAREGAVVGQDLGYRSEQDASGLEQVEVGGVVVHRLPLPPNIRVRALLVLAKLVLGLMAAVAGLVVMWAAPGASERALAAARESWWRAWLRGLGVLALPLAVIALAGLLLWLAPTEAGLPLVGILVPLFVAVLGVVLAMAFVSPVAAFPWLGRLGSPERGPVRAFLYGTVAVIIASLVPWLVWSIVLFVVPLGIGAWLSPLLARQSQPIR